MIKIVSRCAASLDRIPQVVFDPSNQAVFMALSGEHSSEVKLYATSSMDQITSFPHHNDSAVRFVAAYTSKQ